MKEWANKRDKILVWSLLIIWFVLIFYILFGGAIKRSINPYFICEKYYSLDSDSTWGNYTPPSQNKIDCDNINGMVIENKHRNERLNKLFLEHEKEYNFFLWRGQGGNLKRFKKFYNPDLWNKQ